MRVKLLDTKTNKELWTDDFYNSFWWAEGNGSCDCNRELYFINYMDDSNTCKGCKRYLIIEFENADIDYSLLEYNSGYPEKLVEKYLKGK